MQRLRMAIAVLLAMSAPCAAQERSAATVAPDTTSAFRVVLTEAAIARCHAALKLSAAQERLWPAAAQALRVLTRSTKIDEAAVRHLAGSVRPLLTSLDDTQMDVALAWAERAGLSQYASMF